MSAIICDVWAIVRALAGAEREAEGIRVKIVDMQTLLSTRASFTGH